MSEKKRAYTTPKGVDERIVDYPLEWADVVKEEAEKRDIRVMNWNGFKILQGPGYGANWFNMLVNRRRKDQSIIILVTGPPGEGKTYCALRLAEIFDKDFDVTTQVAFNREQVHHLFGANSPLKRGQAIVIDEAHFGAGARRWYESLQIDLMNSMAAIRSKGFMLFIIALHRNMLDKIIRQFVLTFQLHLESRGDAVIYQISMPRFEDKPRYKRLGILKLQLPGVEQCKRLNCLDCDYRGECMVSRATYERQKEDFLNTVSEQIEKKEADKRLAATKPSDNELIEMIYKNRHKLYYTGTGTIEWTSVKDIVQELGWSIGRSSAIGLKNKLQRKYPDLKPPGA